MSAELASAFEAFASFGGAPTHEMDNAHFSKMCKETGLVDKVFTTVDVDMIFTKTKAKGERKINFHQFVDSALPAIAAKKKSTPEQIAAQITAGSPQSSGTKAEHTRFHDDKEAYTGVYKAGGPTNVDRDSGNLSGLVDRRNTADVRGVTATQHQTHH
jgi:hypothetical protein